MNKPRFIAIVTSMALMGLCTLTGLSGDVDFSSEILPILSENCFHCHGPDQQERKADLRLDTGVGARHDLGGHAAVVPGKPNDSELVHRIETDDSEEMMPPSDSGKTLTAQEIQKLRQWIQQGGEYEAHWAFMPVSKNVQRNGKATIDTFIEKKLQQAGLSFSLPADRQKLIRRATFDLTGLSPTWSEVEAFVNDPDPDAFEKVIDRLLGSPAYGERWGRHWLDLARYADTHGGGATGFTRFPFSYTYRDYVIAAFNDDVPYHRFILEQLAADQLKLRKNDPALAALGFLTVGRQYRNRHDRLDDQIDVITRGLLGLTVSCARCHDHKFDPIPTTDYYSLHATLASSNAPFDLPLTGNPEVVEKYEAELEKRELRRDDIVREHGEVFRGRLRMQVGMYLTELAKGTPEQDTSTSFLSYRTEDLRPIILERWRKHLKNLDEDDPVFGPWHRLSKIGKEGFQDHCRKFIQELTKQNGDPKKYAAEHTVSTSPPKWNPRILEAIVKKEPTSFVEVAEVYGEVFANTQRQWMTSLLDASLEAAPGGNLISDQDPKHRIVNSSIERQLRHHLHHPDSPTAISFDGGRDLNILNRGVRDYTSGSIKGIDKLNLAAYAPPRSMILREAVDPGEKSYVFLRGNPVSRGKLVEPAFLTALAGEERTAFPAGERRLGLARAIVDPSNPLSRRVVVNWVWQHHFGQGLVRTSDDFGTRGDPPTHPELLDYLAETLLEDSWSLKALHRRIMLSKTWHQDSVIDSQASLTDPENRLLWRMPVRKLGMEAMRDSLLSVSGELDATAGGQPFEEKGSKAIPRRSVYAFVNRDVISKMASTFDGADPSACTVKRPATMVPQQTLYALNSDYIQDRAQALVQLPEIQSVTTAEDRVALIYQRIFSRLPDDDEINLAIDFFSEVENPNTAWSQFVHALLASNEFHFVD